MRLRTVTGPKFTGSKGRFVSVARHFLGRRCDQGEICFLKNAQIIPLAFSWPGEPIKPEPPAHWWFMLFIMQRTTCPPGGQPLCHSQVPFLTWTVRVLEEYVEFVSFGLLASMTGASGTDKSE
jgi:hypothetical protein